MENFTSYRDFFLSFLIISLCPLLLLLPVASAKYRLKLLGVALVFALLIEFSLFLFRNSPVSPTSWNDLFIWHFSRATIVFLPIIFFALVLLSLAENRIQVLEITLGYIGVILSVLFLGGNISTAWIPLILAPVLFIILMRKSKRSLALSIFYLVIVGIFSFFYASNIWITGTADFHKELARRHGYTDVELFHRHQRELGVKSDLEEARKMISEYYRKTGTYPRVLNEKIEYFFIWNDISGKSRNLLINFLNKKFKRNWVRNAEIIKSKDDKTIVVKDRKNWIILNLNTKIKEVIIEIGDEKIYNEVGYPLKYGYSLKEKNGKLYVFAYEYRNEISEIKIPATNHPFSNNVFIVHTNPNQKIQPSQITDEGGWIYSSDSGDIRINCSHKDSNGIPYYEW